MNKILIKEIEEVEALSGGKIERVFEVTVASGDGGGSEEGEKVHTVRADSEYVRELGWGADDALELVRKSFEFLLEHESKESILSEFTLSDIAHYFPTYEKYISK